MRVFGFTGRAGAGKTTLLGAVMRVLTGRGLSLSTVKHAHHGFDLDRPGKDSFRHREAGAREVMIASDTRWALLGQPTSLDGLLARMAPVDLILVEGFGADPHPKIEVHRPVLGHAPLWPGRTDIVAVATDTPLDCPLMQLDLNNPGLVADFIATRIGLCCPETTTRT